MCLHRNNAYAAHACMLLDTLCMPSSKDGQQFTWGKADGNKDTELAHNGMAQHAAKHTEGMQSGWMALEGLTVML